MPRTQVYEAVTERLEILDTEGRVDTALMPEIDPSRIRDLYRDMVLMRTFDAKALKLQRQGRMGTWPPIKGQEAVQAGVAMAIGQQLAEGSTEVFGVMLESFLVAGRQDNKPGTELQYGQSITDACMSWDATVPVLEGLADATRKRRTAGT